VFTRQAPASIDVLPILVLIPVGTSLVFGVVYLLLGDVRPGLKILVTLIFVFAVYLQFSRHSPVGLVLQVGLALYLVAWQKMNAAR